MKLLIDGYWWEDGPHSNRMVLHEIVREWVRSHPDDDLLLAVPARRNSRPGEPIPPGIAVTRTHLRRHPVINILELPAIARRRGLDAVLAFNFAAYTGRGVVFIHDVLFQSNPEWFTSRERAYFSAIPLLARRATCVITTSESECRRIMRCNPALHRVVGCGLSTPTALSVGPARDPGLGLTPGRYLLCVGRLNVRKNLERTIRSALRSGAVSESCPLVIVGEPSGRLTAINSEFRGPINDQTVVLVGAVSYPELKWLYQRCLAFVYLALDEGFGLPPVEALNCGAQVLASDIPVFRETVGTHALLVNPTDEAAIAEGIRLVASGRYKPSPSTDREQDNWASVCQKIRNEVLTCPPRRAR
ncbi:glycosyltransferase family 4 protein [Rhodococcus sp. NPDC003322]